MRKVIVSSLSSLGDGLGLKPVVVSEGRADGKTARAVKNTRNRKA
jgi:hypothetical protein